MRCALKFAMPIVLLLALLAGAVWASQDGAAPPTPPPQHEEQDFDPFAPDGPPRGMPEPLQRDRMRQFLSRNLERMQRQEKAMEEGLRMLDEGAPMADVREHTRLAITGELMERGRELRGIMRQRNGQGPVGAPLGPGRFPRGMGEPPPGVGPQGDEPALPFDTDLAMEVIKETNPPLHERLDLLRENSPEEFKQVLERHTPRLTNLLRDRQQRPEEWPDRVRMLILERQSFDTVRSIPTLQGDDRAAAESRLRTMLEEMFDLRIKIAQNDIARLRQRISALEDEISGKTDRRQAMVESRLKQMIERAEETEHKKQRSAPR